MMSRNLTLMTDLYQLTMMNGYYQDGTYKNEAVFDMFFRYKPELNYAIFAGLEQVIDYIKNLKFSQDDIEYLRGLNIFDEGFLSYLAEFKFTGDIYSAVEGEIVFPYEPILIVKAPLIQAQLIETAMLTIIGHQTLIATKSSRIVDAADGKSVVEFGLRRAQGPDAGIYGSRASIIGGCTGTSNVLAAKEFNIPVKGTHAHSWVMSFKTELEAFERFAELFPDNCLLLVDTYDTLGSGVPNAIKVFKKLKEQGHKPIGIRLDSGDLAYLSKMARKMLDEAGFNDAIIFASGDISEEVLTALNVQGAKIDVYGVGTKLITSEKTPSLGGVYKLARIEIDGEYCDRMKISSSLEKITNPGFKKVLRLYDKKTGKAVADVIALRDEELPKPITLRHETELWKKFTLEDYDVREILVDIFKDGKCVYNSPSLSEMASYAKAEKAKLWEEYKRLLNPNIYRVNISKGVYDIKQKFLTGVREEK
ncbi:MAG: nicotinate phosphoribosyltransferase [Clostridiales bacterium]|nr:nicotinate phosphoribosyltransferase [Clostridiales bacterium]